MWIVRNILRGTLQISDLNIKIPAREYYDLDQVGRQAAQNSTQLKLAFAEGYLQNIKKLGPTEKIPFDLLNLKDFRNFQ